MLFYIEGIHIYYLIVQTTLRSIMIGVFQMYIMSLRKLQ